ncbi:MAG: hypothetical protein JRI68_00905 [Deltaproteobacteria bacterium]|nr:hypothetical protein [Deltaproteobacteria bacterium]
MDRSRFLALTAALAAGGCGGPLRPSPDPPRGSVVELDPPRPARGLTGSASTAEPAPEPLPTVAPPQDGGPLSDDPYERLDQLIQQLEGSQGSCSRPQVPQNPMTARMEEQPQPIVGPARGCDRLREPPGPHCEDFVLVVVDCTTTLSPLVSPVARRALSCLQAKSGTQALCGARRVVARCAAQAVIEVPIKPATAAVCAEIVAQCEPRQAASGSKPTVVACQQYLSAQRCWHLAEGSQCLAGACSVDECLQMSY